ncbi:MAG: hypothetical protein BGO43_02425 [Gammaproteobacteria bacterium 39-13]|mgnify:CR=1 FL=1|jgi:hypothetical protein|nr:hypothetical protein [Gammaproteobacteria bacterium]OJV91145.1 MAG: hypothetical protein BGO43_02425 [Gammaproteobacteria bacterium 39-13]
MVAQTWDEYSRQYKQLVNNIATALNDRFHFDTAADRSISSKDFNNAVDSIINSHEGIQQQFRSLLNDASKMISQMNVPRADGFTSKQLNQQKGAEVSEKEREVPEWAKSLMDNAPPGESPLIQNADTPNASADNKAENRAENSKKLKLTPGMELKLQNAPKLTAALKKDLEVQYTPKIKPSSPF